MIRTALLIGILTLALAPGCSSPGGPSQGGNPGGDAVIWFNGLSATVDAYFPLPDSLIQGCWNTGDTPNAMVCLGEGRFAVLSSLGADIRLFDSEHPGAVIGSVALPPGSNPFDMAVMGDRVFVTLLLSSSVAVVDLASMTVTSQWDVPGNPTGIAAWSDRVFVTHGSWPEQSPGGVTVLDAETGQELAWLDTGENTGWARVCPLSGKVHAGATTYNDDGSVAIIDPSVPAITAVIPSGGTPGKPVRVGDAFVSPNGWGGNRLLVYHEDGVFHWVDVDYAATGLALHGNFLYATDFSENSVRIITGDDFSVVKTLPSGGEGPQGIIAVDR